MEGDALLYSYRKKICIGHAFVANKRKKKKRKCKKKDVRLRLKFEKNRCVFPFALCTRKMELQNTQESHKEGRLLSSLMCDFL